MRRELAWIGNDRVRLGLLLLVLAALTVYAGASWGGFLSQGGGVAAGAGCPAGEAPGPTAVSRATLADLRAEVQRVVHFDRRLRPYEAGAIPTIAVWADTEPGPQRALPRGKSSAGYEMRWWLPSGDDFVADAFEFASRRDADDFLAIASRVDCRVEGKARKAALPSGGRDLRWRNPDGFIQEDLFLVRGRRVYRVSVVRPGAADRVGRAEEAIAFKLVNLLACGLPPANCSPARARAYLLA